MAGAGAAVALDAGDRPPSAQAALAGGAQRRRGVVCLAGLQGEHQLLARLLYGTGLRITEALCLRVRDIDFAQRAIYVRQGKGGRGSGGDAAAILGPAVASSSAGSPGLGGRCGVGACGGGVAACSGHLKPQAGASWGWFWVFPRTIIPPIPTAASFASGTISAGRTFQRAFKRAVRRHRHQTRHASPLRHCLRPICFRRVATSAPCKVTRARRCGDDHDLPMCARDGRRCRARPLDSLPEAEEPQSSRW